MKILSVNNEKCGRYYNSLFGEEFSLYPEGTIRVVRKLIWFKWKIVEQVASIKIAAGLDGAISYNSWETIKKS